MTLPHNTATATVIIDGLGICCFNHRRQFWEVGYLRHNHNDQQDHKLRLTVDAQSRDIDHDVIIRIETINGISLYREYPDGYFGSESVDRKKDVDLMTQDEKENFRWAVNLEDPLDEIKQGKGMLMKPHFGVTRAFIEDAVFYTRSLPEEDLFNLSLAEDGSSMDDQELDDHRFGKTNDSTAGDITCANDGAVNVIIEDSHGHSEIFASLPHRTGDPHIITLTNMRPNDNPVSSNRPVKGDFQLYYDAFELENNRKKRALWGFPVFDQSNRTDCNLVWVGTTDDLDALF